MKMPSTYISLLLCGLMFFFYSHLPHARSAPQPAMIRPVVKEIRPVVKRFLNAKPDSIPLSKLKGNENLLRQTGLTEGFSFLRDVIGQIAPLLKNVK